MTAQELKNAILMRAVQGKLVPQDPNDEPASVLLEKIRAEKEQLMKDKKIKKEPISIIYKDPSDNQHYEKVGKEVKCIEDEIPFEIPESWEWCRLGSILTKLTDGTHSTPHYTGSGIPFISVKDISSGNINFSNTKFISKAEHDDLYKRCDPKKGDMLLTKVGTTGIPVIVDTDVEFSLFVSVALLRYNRAYLSNNYMRLLILSPLVQKQCSENTRGVGNKNWVMRDIANTLICIPPYAEQKRIREHFLEYEPIISKYNIYYNKLETLNASVQDNIQKSILQYAIQGKLVPQNPNDEPASVLLERIREEKEQMIKDGKIKRDKNESYIYRGSDNSYYEKFADGTEKCIDEELPFEIPDSWMWCRLSEILEVKGGKRLPKGEKFQDIPSKHIYIRVTDMKEHTISSDKIVYISDETYAQIKNYTISSQDLYLTIAGTIGNCGIVPQEFNGMNLTENAVKLTNIRISKAYILTMLQTEYMQNQFTKRTNKVAQPKLAITRILTSLVPLAPANEQLRILQTLESVQKI